MININELCVKYSLSPNDLRSLLVETDASRGLLTPRDLEAGLSQVLAVYIGALTATADRVESAADRLVIDKFMRQALESLHAQLDGAGTVRN